MVLGINIVPCANSDGDGSSKTVIILISAEYFLAKSNAKSNALSADLEPSIGTRIFLNKRFH